jgi:hypothetical protein
MGIGDDYGVSSVRPDSWVAELDRREEGALGLVVADADGTVLPL